MRVRCCRSTRTEMRPARMRACAHARRVVSPPKSSPGRLPGVACEVRLREPGGTLGWGGARGDGSEVDGRPERLHLRA